MCEWTLYIETDYLHCCKTSQKLQPELYYGDYIDFILRKTDAFILFEVLPEGTVIELTRFFSLFTKMSHYCMSLHGTLNYLTYDLPFYLQRVFLYDF